MQRIAKAVPQADGHRADVGSAQRCRQREHAGFIQRADDPAIGPDALGNFKAQFAWRQRRRQLQFKIVGVVAPLQSQFKHIGEPASSYQRRANAFAFDQRVGDQRRAMNHLGNLVRQHLVRGHQQANTLQHSLRRIGGRRQDFFVVDLAASRIKQNEIGERATDINADAVVRLRGCQSRHPRVSRR